jgi:hypothetical protein
MQRSTARWLSLGLLLGLVGCETSSSVIDESRDYAKVGNYYLAYKLLEGARDPNHPDAELDTALQAARLDYLISLAQGDIFSEHEDLALEKLNQALAIAPGNKVVKDLIQRAHLKQARRQTQKGTDFLSDGDLQNALLAFTAAEQAVPGFKPAVAGKLSVQVTFNSMHLKAQQHFLEALRQFPELHWVQVQWHTTTALENDPSRNDARDLRERAQRKIAEQSFQGAQAAEKNRQYGAALMEYRSVRDMQPDYPSIDAHIAEMQREVEAQHLVDSALMKMLRGNFGEALKVLKQAFDTTSLEKASISEAILRTRKRQGELAYQHAKDLELQNKKEEALSAYKAVAAQWPDGLKDEKVRIENLQSDVDHALQAWKAAEEAEKNGDVKAAIQNYETAAIYYPGWQDVDQRLAKLKAKLQQRP